MASDSKKTMFSRYETEIRPEWTEAGHLAVGSYMTIFDHATDCLREHVGLGKAYASRTNSGLYVAEAHIAYERVLHAGDSIKVDTVVLGVDPKKLHLLHQMRRQPNGVSVAVVELIVLNVDRTTGRTVPVPDPILTRLRALAALHAHETVPPLVGRPLSLNRPKQS